MAIGEGVGVPFRKILSGISSSIKALILVEDIKLWANIDKLTTNKATAIGLGYNFEL